MNIAPIAIVSNIIFALGNHQLNLSQSKRKTHQKQKKTLFTYTETDFLFTFIPMQLKHFRIHNLCRFQLEFDGFYYFLLKKQL